jgi:hypothetical protein
VLPSRLAAIKIPSGGKESIRGARERSQTTFCQDDPLTLSSNANLSSSFSVSASRSTPAIASIR